MKEKAAHNKNLPRHSAGSMELKEGTGPIRAMCSCGNFLEIYKQDKTFRVQTPEAIDPDETNPNAPWVASPVSDVGSSNLTVARVLLQADEMLNRAGFDEAFDKEAVISHLHSCKETLIACEKISQRIINSIEDIINRINEKGIGRDNHGRGLNPFPQVNDLDVDCGNFLIQINRAIKLVSELPNYFISLPRLNSNFDHLAKQLRDSLGVDSPVTEFVAGNAEVVRYLINLRNYHEHPKRTQTQINNFRVLPNGNIQEPGWCLAGEITSDFRSIKTEVKEAVDFVRELAELMFVYLLMHRITKKFPYVIRAIEEKDIPEYLPVRYELTIDFAKIHSSNMRSEEQ